jgi:hypothetical protein
LWDLEGCGSARVGVALHEGEEHGVTLPLWEGSEEVSEPPLVDLSDG